MNVGCPGEEGKTCGCRLGVEVIMSCLVFSPEDKGGAVLVGLIKSEGFAGSKTLETLCDEGERAFCSSVRPYDARRSTSSSDMDMDDEALMATGVAEETRTDADDTADEDEDEDDEREDGVDEDERADPE